ncbi:hypothetical protein QFZ29_003563 [Agromyces albus]|nr:hypothetical protein [Agromyces albus]
MAPEDDEAAARAEARTAAVFVRASYFAATT